MAGEFPLQAPSEWRRVSLEEISEFITKGTTPTTLGFNWTDSGVLFLRSECVSENGFTRSGTQFISPEAHIALERSIVKAGDILVTITGNVGRSCLLPESVPEANINQHIARVRIRPDAQAVPSFVCYQLSHSSYRQHFARIVTGLAYPQISLKQIREAIVALPPLREQRKIAAILSSVDDTIEKTQAVIDQLEAVKNGFLGELTTLGVPGWHKELNETAIGTIPASWRVQPLSEVARIERGKFTHRPRNDPKLYGGPYPFIQTGDVAASNGRITRFSQTLNDEGLGVSKLFQAGTIVMTIAANIGDTGIAMMPVAFPDSLVGIQPRPDVDVRFLEYVLRTRKQELEDAAPQNAQKNINLQILAPISIQVPPLEEQRAIADCLDSFDTRVASERAYLTQIGEAKKALLDVLLSGKVLVPPSKQEAA